MKYLSIEYAKEMKIAEMSFACNTTIEKGFDIMLSDGVSEHFSMRTHDQINLITLQSMVASGETMIPYHADGELCKYYSVADITAIMNEATSHKTFHITYYNSLKSYIDTLTDIDAISAVQYGMEIPEEYQSDILKGLYRLMAGGVQ